jgi:hypothetical protein
VRKARHRGEPHVPCPDDPYSKTLDQISALNARL